MKKAYAALSLVIFVLFIAAGTFFIWVYLSQYDGNYELFREFIFSYGIYAHLVFTSLQILQIFFALIPGEFIEFAAGYIFGEWIGFFLCMAGIALASSFIFFLVRKFGLKLFEQISGKKGLQEFKFLDNEKKLNLLVFFIFLIPGTPKDLLTYFVGLTKMKYPLFIAITLFARIPSVITSTIAGASAGQGRYTVVFVIYGITAILTIGGLLIYRRLKSRTAT